MEGEMFQKHHNANELFSLGFIHGGPDRALCTKCGSEVPLGKPKRGLAVYYASQHRMHCGR
jgi:hypothetical protein